MLVIWTVATPGTATRAQQAQAAPIVQPETRRRVEVIALPQTTGDDQASWIIKTDVPRIPRLPGLDPQLPPHIESRLSYAFDLAQRGATYSANNEFRAVLALCALELDGRNGGTSRRDALQQAWTAVAEADEFAAASIDWRNPADMRRAVAGHATPVLKTRGAANELPADSIQAVQLYYAFAEERLAAACDGLPGASLACYGMARTYVVPGNRLPHADGKAALLHRVALALAPQNVLAANELGVILAQHGHLDEAERILRHCVATSPTAESWRNLAIVCSRKGDHEASRAALAASEALVASDPAVAQQAAQPARQENELSQRGSGFTKINPPRIPIPFRR